MRPCGIFVAFFTLVAFKFFILNSDVAHPLFEDVEGFQVCG
jgi:hypothetical protein